MQADSIYVLYAVAGIGKSLVSKTLAERAAKRNPLDASFFSRDDDNRKTLRWIFPTLIYHFGVYDGLEAVPFFDCTATAARDRRRFSSSSMHLLNAKRMAQEPCYLSLHMKYRGYQDSEVFVTARPELHVRSVLAQYQVVPYRTVNC